MLSRAEIEESLKKIFEIPVFRERAHATEYRVNNQSFYLKKSDKAPLVIHPDWMGWLKKNPISGVIIQTEPYHNTNLATFPRLNQRANFGLDIDVEDAIALQTLLTRLGLIYHEVANLWRDITQARSELATLSETERETLIQARLGQGLFRKRLEQVWTSRLRTH